MSKTVLDIFEVPNTPNFIKYKRGGGIVTVPIEDFDDDDLVLFAAEWTSNLLNKARKRRN